MRDDNARNPYDAPVETEGMGGAGGGDLDDVGDVGFPRDGSERDVTRGRGDREGIGGAGGGDIDDIGATRGSDREVVRGDTGVVTGITTGVDTDDATEGPGSLWENLDDGEFDSDERGTDTSA